MKVAPKHSRVRLMTDSAKTAPASEAWLFKSQEALASVKRGLADSAAGRTNDLGSFAPKKDST